MTEAIGVPANRGGFAHPPVAELVGVGAGLAGPGVDRRLAGDRRQLPLVRIPTLPVPELGHLDVAGHVDLAGALGEHLQQCRVDAGELGLPIDDRPPRHLVPGREVGAEHGLVVAAQHPLEPLQIAGVERQPASIGGLHPRRDHGVGVQLRVIGP